MTYLQTYSQLREAFSGEEPQAPLGPGLWLQNLTFVSGGLRCPGQEGAPPPADLLALLPGGTDLSSLFSVPDGDISENREFRYHVVRPDGAPGRGAIILLHGFNERHWDKYLPMAAFLAGRTGKSVILFPIAFHMNRAPALWNDARVMRKVSQWRKSVHPNVLESTLSNAAISIRLHQDPARFFWSGLETYENIVSLSRTIIGGGHPAFDGPATVDFFTYSIGSFLGEIVMLADEDSLFGDSRLAIFCGGPVFNRLSPVSKFILDSEASVSLYSFLIEHLDSH
ncbi:MAG: DUF6051 family protein, partial [Deltaproteobacteria bacterium]|nr:DUF6051 family protein [Deltaproteobacteria bacterium]